MYWINITMRKSMRDDKNAVNSDEESQDSEEF